MTLLVTEQYSKLNKIFILMNSTFNVYFCSEAQYVLLGYFNTLPWCQITDAPVYF